MNLTKVEVIADTIHGTRLTTIACRYPRIIHGEVMTHRVFSRNAQSSRACPTARILEQDVFMPEVWTANRKGMSASKDLPADKAREATEIWQWMHAAVALGTAQLGALGVHKQHANRAIEPFQYINVLITATDWENFLVLREAPDAQPEIQLLARMIRAALAASVPDRSDVHMPYADKDTPAHMLAAACAARCARVSYGAYDGSGANWRKDVDLANTLWRSQHMSPFEHIAYAGDGRANLRGWVSLREKLDAGGRLIMTEVL
jgi:thymidylate synthase ThyX